MDLLPTMHSLTNSSPPADAQLDGKSFAHQLWQQQQDPAGKKEESRFLPVFWHHHLISVRYGAYKLHIRSVPIASDEMIVRRLRNGVYPGKMWYMHLIDNRLTELDPPLLYNIFHDPGEKYPLNLEDFADVYDDILEELNAYMPTVPTEVDMLVTPANRHRRFTPCSNPPYCLRLDSLLSKSVCPAVQSHVINQLGE